MTDDRAVIFDLDGVITSTDELHYRSWKELADAEGIPFDREINLRLRGISRIDCVDIFLEQASRPHSAEEKLAIAERKNARYLELLADMTREDLAPGLLDLLDELDASHVRRAVASSSRNARRILDQLTVTDRFHEIVDGNDVPMSKPDPTVFLTAAQRLGVRPSRCVVIEDAAAGIRGAHEAGMAAIGIGTPATLPEAELRFESIAELHIDTLLQAIDLHEARTAPAGG
jgi:beta-phosphoglucomutase